MNCLDIELEVVGSYIMVYANSSYHPIEFKMKSKTLIVVIFLKTTITILLAKILNRFRIYKTSLMHNFIHKNHILLSSATLTLLVPPA